MCPKTGTTSYLQLFHYLVLYYCSNHVIRSSESESDENNSLEENNDKRDRN